MKRFNHSCILLTGRWNNKLTAFLFGIVLSAGLANSQEVSPRNLVFEGSGIRGIAFAGAIQELEKNKLMEGVERVGGTSAGAITALLLSLGYTSSEIVRIVNNTPYKKFNDGNFFFIGGINRFSKYFGWYRGRHVENWLEDLIERKTGNSDITFLQLYEKGYKDLYVTGTCLNRQSLIIFSRESYPNMKVKDAVRISMSIPLYFEAVQLDTSGQIVKHPKNNSGLDVMIDGGITGNYPIKMFDSTKYTAASGNNRFMVNPETLGFRIDRIEQIESDKKNHSLTQMPVTNIREYFGAFYTILLENLNRQTLTDADWQRTVSISDGAIAPRIRKLSDTELDILIHNGRAATKNFFLPDTKPGSSPVN